MYCGSFLRKTYLAYYFFLLYIIERVVRQVAHSCHTTLCIELIYILLSMSKIVVKVAHLKNSFH